MKKFLSILLALFILVLLALFILNSTNNTASNGVTKATTEHQNLDFSNIEAGNTIAFGYYEQDNDNSNGKEPIDWLVLDVKGGEAFIVSKYGLDCKPYNSINTDVTWENCSLRSWLNDDFFNEAFDSKHKAIIKTANVINDDNTVGTDGGNNTADKVFVLSVDEANRYFSDLSRMCEPTVYAKSNGVLTLSASPTCRWWLRTPGIKSGINTEVDFNGKVDNFGCFLDSPYNAVRPAMWISID